MAALPDDATVKRLAAEILARTEYARFRVSSEVLQRILKAIAAMLAWVARLALEHPILYRLMLVGLFLLTGGLIAHIVWTVMVANRAPKTKTPEPTRDGPRDLALEARALAERGAYLEAAHAMLLASLAYSARARWLELRPEDGNRIVRAKLRRSSLPVALQQQLIALIDRTEKAWFGQRGQGADLYAGWCEIYAKLQEVPR